MEDACLTISPFTFRNYSLFAVFDGHGGIRIFYERSLSSSFCSKTISIITIKKRKPQERKVWRGTQRNFSQDGWDFDVWKGSKINRVTKKSWVSKR